MAHQAVGLAQLALGLAQTAVGLAQLAIWWWVVAHVILVSSPVPIGLLVLGLIFGFRTGIGLGLDNKNTFMNFDIFNCFRMDVWTLLGCLHHCSRFSVQLLYTF